MDGLYERSECCRYHQQLTRQYVWTCISRSLDDHHYVPVCCRQTLAIFHLNTKVQLPAYWPTDHRYTIDVYFFLFLAKLIRQMWSHDHQIYVILDSEEYHSWSSVISFLLGMLLLLKILIGCWEITFIQQNNSIVSKNVTKRKQWTSWHHRDVIMVWCHIQCDIRKMLWMTNNFNILVYVIG